MTDWFSHCRTLDEARLEYRRLCFEHHPDHGGNTLVMQAINAAYAQFKSERLGARLARAMPRSTWRRPVRERPRDVAPERSQPPPEPARPSLRSRDDIHRMWRAVPWQPLANGGLGRRVWGHMVMLVRHPAPKYQGAWFVLVDDVFSPYFYNSQHEAETAAFELLYDKVKYPAH